MNIIKNSVYSFHSGKGSIPIEIKIIVHPKMKILSWITHPHVVPNLQDLCSSSEHKLRYFLCIPGALWPFIDSKDPYTIKAQKRSKDIVKIIHVISLVQL